MNRILLATLLLTTLVACNSKLSTKTDSHKEKKEKRNLESPEQEDRSEAAEAMDMWTFSRTFPDGIFRANNLQEAFEQRETQLLRENDRVEASDWRSLGPANVAGRMLCLAFHPTDSMVLWAGSASGGLWKSTTGGLGLNAWQRVKTGFPVLGVSAIAVSPDAQTIYIGTGEVYGYKNTSNSIGIRTQRGSYGIGILKSTDGGVTWSKSMDWVENNMKGVQKIVINPRRSSTVFAATTEGSFRSYDAGKNWTNVSAIPMAVDLEYAPNDTNRLYCTFGSLNNPQNGIFRSLDGGSTWTKLTNGLPTNYSGKTLLSVIASQPNVLFASIADAEQQIGLFKSTNGGDSWTMMNSDNVAAYQGWYSHDVAICPQNPNVVIHIGINASLSSDAGANFSQISNWYPIPLDRTVETQGNYLHADIHAVYFSPFNANKTYFVGDGGIYKNDNFNPALQGTELSFKQLNGGLQTTQFYANFSNSQQDSSFAIGGMQDNWTAIYDGQPNWLRVIGGDGMCTAIHPQDDNIVFGSYQYLGITRSNDHGASFQGVDLGQNRGGAAVFNGPFEIAPSNPNIMYAGAERILRSTDAGQSFLDDNTIAVDSSNSINTIGVNPRRDSSLLVATFPTVTKVAKILKSVDGGKTFSQVSGLPNRIFTDIVYAPKDTNIALATVAGFGTSHVYRTTNAGLTWQPFGVGLPDVPTNTALFDPLDSSIVYVGNDLGVYFSTNAGLNWGPLSNQGLPEACIVMHLSLSPKNRKLRAATHGNGVYEMDMLKKFGVSEPVNVFFNANMETTNEVIRSNFYVKKTGVTDTIGGQLNTLNGNAWLPSLRTNPPDYPYPHPRAMVPFVDSVYAFEIIPKKTNNIRSGVTTLDIAVIARTILGIDTAILNNPYKMLAADVNGNGEVDGVDMLIIRRFILTIDPQFRFVPHWVFIPKTYSMPTVQPRLSEIPQSYFVNVYAPGNPNPLQFWTLKMGDVNNSYDTSLDRLRADPPAPVETRSEGVTLTTEDIYLEEGKVYEVTIKTSKSTTCMGLQGSFCLKNGVYTEGSPFLDLASNSLKNFSENNFNASKNGQIAFSWNDVKNQQFEANTSLFSLKFKAHKSGQLSDVLQLNSDLTSALIFDERGNEKNLTLKFEKINPNVTVEVQPNPFSDVLNLKIGLNTEGSLSYSIFDESGKLVYKNQENLKKGGHILSLNAASIGITQSGVYFLKIETNEGVKTIKLVKI
jgi:photosystem II stability/assembly factor-like uncharacterized protein